MARSTKPAAAAASPRRPVTAGRDALLDRVARRLRSLYWEHYRIASKAITGRDERFGDRYMPQWDGDSTGLTSRSTVSVWHAVAASCLDRQIDPEALVAALFTPLRRPLPLPNAMRGEKFLEKVEAVAAERIVELKAVLASQKETYRVEIRYLMRAYGIDEARAGREALTETGVALSSLFRYCVARRVGDDVLADHFMEGALRLYLFNRSAYDASWGDFIPAELKDAARQLRSRE